MTYFICETNVRFFEKNYLHIFQNFLVLFIYNLVICNSIQNYLFIFSILFSKRSTSSKLI